MKKGEYYLLYDEEIVQILDTKHFTMQKPAERFSECIQTKVVRECFQDPNAYRKTGMIGGTSIELLKDKKVSKKISRLLVELIK